MGIGARGWAAPLCLPLVDHDPEISALGSGFGLQVFPPRDRIESGDRATMFLAFSRESLGGFFAVFFVFVRDGAEPSQALITPLQKVFFGAVGSEDVTDTTRRIPGGWFPFRFRFGFRFAFVAHFETKRGFLVPVHSKSSPSETGVFSSF
jgi:hypothetical protein